MNLRVNLTLVNKSINNKIILINVIKVRQMAWFRNNNKIKTFENKKISP